MLADLIQIWHSLVAAAAASRDVMQFGLLASISSLYHLACFVAPGVAKDMRRYIDACLDDRQARADQRKADVHQREAEATKTRAEAARIERSFRRNATPKSRRVSKTASRPRAQRS